MAHIARAALITTCALLLAACTGGQTTTGSATTAPQARSTTAPQESAAPQESPAPAPAADVCGYLRGRIPTLEGIGSEVGAMANLTTNLYSWYEEQGAVPDGKRIDEQLAKECPDVAAQVYRLAGITSFATL